MHRIAVIVEAFQIFSNTIPTVITPSLLRNPEHHNDNYHPRSRPRKYRARRNDEHGEDEDDDSTLRRRMYPLQIATLEQIFQRSLPISTIPCTTTTLKNNQGHNQDESHQVAHHHPIPFIEFCFHCLLNNDQPFPDSGIRFLLRVSTPAWRHKIYQSVGYHDKNTMLRQGVAIVDSCFEESMLSAISATMTQDQNQFGILVGEGAPYRICFPSEPLEYDDDMSSLTEKDIAGMENDLRPSSTTSASTVWIECQLRHYDTNELLVMMGWQLRVLVHYDKDDDNDNYRKEYQIDRVDWQDFREQFRPGIGREEWVRICG